MSDYTRQIKEAVKLRRYLTLEDIIQPCIDNLIEKVRKIPSQIRNHSNRGLYIHHPIHVQAIFENSIPNLPPQINGQYFVDFEWEGEDFWDGDLEPTIFTEYLVFRSFFLSSNQFHVELINHPTGRQKKIKSAA